MNLEWAHAVAAIIGACFGVASSLFTGGWRFGRIEGRLKLHVQETMIDSEKRLEAKLDTATSAFDETLRALRQKINDVELNSERRYLLKDEFSDFRTEYRQDMARIFSKLDSLPGGRRGS